VVAILEHGGVTSSRGELQMATKGSVRNYTMAARNARTVEAKLDQLSHAVEELAKFLDDVLYEVRHLEGAIKRLK
jgi:hypothetical protein